MSRGSIVAAGTVNGHNTKAFTFGIPVNAKMAPNARIITYYVRADGEIVTDSISFDVEGVFENKVSICHTELQSCKKPSNCQLCHFAGK